uniref:Uncharacterized protein n=1 Tax=Romanomermis culicivorax TaxID=13658 RepID=A0A915HRM0_ROMCU
DASRTIPLDAFILNLLPKIVQITIQANGLELIFKHPFEKFLTTLGSRSILIILGVNNRKETTKMNDHYYITIVVSIMITGFMIKTMVFCRNFHSSKEEMEAFVDSWTVCYILQSYIPKNFLPMTGRKGLSSFIILKKLFSFQSRRYVT